MTTTRLTFTQAMDRALDSLLAAALRLTGRRAAAEDLVQDTLLLAYQNWDSFSEGTNSKAWLHRILFNTFVSGYRKQRRELRALDLALDPTKVEQFVSHDLLRAHALDGGVARQGFTPTVQTALDALIPEFRDVLILSDVAELSYREVAEVLHCPIGTVMSRLHRARRALARKLTVTRPELAKSHAA
jgi:RNA polymerase sigma-70 factor (ECF subfamily)